MKQTPLKRNTPLKSGPFKKKAEPKAKGPKKREKNPHRRQAFYKNKCDALAQKRCVSLGYCEACEYGHPKAPDCKGLLSWCHLKSRRFAILRHDPKNSVCMCAAHHRFFTDHPDLFRDFIEEKFPGRWAYLNVRLQENVKVNYYLLYLALVEQSSEAA